MTSLIQPSRKSPFVSVWGDHSEGAVGFNGDTRRNGCVATVDALKGRSADASMLMLPARGITGNSHMMMLDKNNLAIADLLIGSLRSARG